ncbi:recombination protein O N-terminal domain-containing protein [Mycoplasma anserisalpingitidis]|uniref:recombination protein O N-terminal domain-containing protein n=1 Tax=Mycoplasma anserisalpingitidis TaxID=519450 RepID=UPI0011B1630F|nr:recombination protein O N-terminal domain-containing protein [Mycoplasma anserisalpingitidis]QDY87452.1 hypothetical protein FOY45_00710 [Mycoplasma anserisalpingitidis]UCU26853.1 recombination protein O N-terminal domain-containing protein [Mycoplasma anserisalpingitidis]UCU27692.1 recombination protein O N-terminal domain-containing protein [Mycoplasma anserisalpingitidis]
MAESKCKAILLNLTHSDDNKSFLTFLTSDGIMQLYAHGLTKPDSKNRYNLFVGSIVEISFFKARLKGSVGKLKKATLIKQVKSQTQSEIKTVMLLCKILKNFNFKNNIINFYYYFIDNIGKGKNNFLITILLSKLIYNFGIKPVLSACVECLNQKDLVDFKIYKGGFLCKNHALEIIPNQDLKSIFNLFYDYNLYLQSAGAQINKYLKNEFLNILSDHGVNFN